MAQILKFKNPVSNKVPTFNAGEISLHLTSVTVIDTDRLCRAMEKYLSTPEK